MSDSMPVLPEFINKLHERVDLDGIDRLMPLLGTSRANYYRWVKLIKQPSPPETVVLQKETIRRVCFIFDWKPAAELFPAATLKWVRQELAQLDQQFDVVIPLGPTLAHRRAMPSTKGLKAFADLQGRQLLDYILASMRLVRRRIRRVVLVIASDAYAQAAAFAKGFEKNDNPRVELRSSEQCVFQELKTIRDLSDPFIVHFGDIIPLTDTFYSSYLYALTTTYAASGSSMPILTGATAPPESYLTAPPVANSDIRVSFVHKPFDILRLVAKQDQMAANCSAINMAIVSLPHTFMHYVCSDPRHEKLELFSLLSRRNFRTQFNYSAFVFQGGAWLHVHTDSDRQVLEGSAAEWMPAWLRSELHL